MKKFILTIAAIAITTTAFSQEIKLNIEKVKEGNKIRNQAIVTAAVGSVFAFWGSKRENAKPMVWIGAAVASLSIPMTIIGDRKIKKEIKKFN